METTSAIPNHLYLTEETPPTKNIYVNAFDVATSNVFNWLYPLYHYEQSVIFELPVRLTNPSFGREYVDNWIREKAHNAPTIERVRQITTKLPSLTKLLLDERNNE